MGTKDRRIEHTDRVILLEDLPKGTVLALRACDTSGGRIVIALPDRRVPWFDYDPERGLYCLTSRLEAG